MKTIKQEFIKIKNFRIYQWFKPDLIYFLLKEVEEQNAKGGLKSNG